MTLTVKIEGKSLVRNMNSKALTETNLSIRERYLQSRQKMQKLQNDKDNRINNLENEVGELKKLIFELLNKNKEEK